MAKRWAVCVIGLEKEEMSVSKLNLPRGVDKPKPLAMRKGSKKQTVKS